MRNSTSGVPFFGMYTHLKHTNLSELRKMLLSTRAPYSETCDLRPPMGP